MHSSELSFLIAAGIGHGVRNYEAMEPMHRSGCIRFGVLFNEATHRRRRQREDLRGCDPPEVIIRDIRRLLETGGGPAPGMGNQRAREAMPEDGMGRNTSTSWKFSKNRKFVQKGLAGLPAIPMFAAPKQGTRVFQAKCVIVLGITESIS